MWGPGPPCLRRSREEGRAPQRGAAGESSRQGGHWGRQRTGSGATRGGPAGVSGAGEFEASMTDRHAEESLDESRHKTSADIHEGGRVGKVQIVV